MQKLGPLNQAYVSTGNHMQPLAANGEIQVAPGQSFDVYVPENQASNGYSWQAMLGSASPFIQQSSHLTTLQAPQPGALRPIPAREFTFTVKPGNAGPLQVELQLQRPWQENVPPADVKRLTITVSQPSV